MIAAYFDESVRDDGQQPICVGGFYFQPSGYKKFSRYWRSNVLRFRGRRVDPFHMTDLCAGKGVYKGMTISDRISVLNHAVYAIRNHTLGAVAVYFDQREFIAKAPPEWPQIFGSIYTVACHLCLQTTSFWLRDRKIQGTVLYTFEQGHNFEDEADRFMKAIAKHDATKQLFRYRNHLFEPKSEVGLQAADLYAWTITKAKVADGHTPRGMRPFVAPLLNLTEGTAGKYRYHQFVGASLDQFIHENLTNPILLFLDRGPRKPDFR